MKFILKDNLIHIVENHGMPNNNMKVEVIHDLDGYKLQYKVNDNAYKDIESNHLTILKEHLKKTTLQITIRAIKDKAVTYFESDVLPLTHGIILGKPLEEAYPKIIQHLIEENKRIREFIGLTARDLKDTMKDLVETFEEINNKGSLF